MKRPRVAGGIGVCEVLWWCSGADAQGLFTEAVRTNVDGSYVIGSRRKGIEMKLQTADRDHVISTSFNSNLNSRPLKRSGLRPRSHVGLCIGVRAVSIRADQPNAHLFISWVRHPRELQLDTDGARRFHWITPPGITGLHLNLLLESRRSYRGIADYQSFAWRSLHVSEMAARTAPASWTRVHPTCPVVSRSPECAGAVNSPIILLLSVVQRGVYS